MRPHTGAYCSVQTAGRRVPSCCGESWAVTVAPARREGRAWVAGNGDAGAMSAANRAALAMIMAKTPNMQPYFFSGGAAGGDVKVGVETGAAGGADSAGP